MIVVPFATLNGTLLSHWRHLTAKHGNTWIRDALYEEDCKFLRAVFTVNAQASLPKGFWLS